MAQINKPSEYFETKIWTGNGTSQNITGLNFQPDFVWIKERTSTSSHAITDSVRGNTKYLMSNVADAEETLTDRVTSFNLDGYSLGSSGGVNQSGQGNVGWSWKAGGTAVSNTDGSITSSVSANTDSGFSIVSYTGIGGIATVGHGLGVAPKFITLKNRSVSNDWWTYTTVIDGSLDYLSLNQANEKADSGVSFPTTSVFSVNESTAPDTNNIIAYCFAEKKGFSKIGKYTGNGSGDGTFVYTGFKPAFVMVKRTNSATTNWQIIDNRRSSANGNNLVDKTLSPNTSDSEYAPGSGWVADLLSNGFKFRVSDVSIQSSVNGNGDPYIYLAIAENPLVGTNNIPATAR